MLNKKIKIAIAGIGTVGKGLIDLLKHKNKKSKIEISAIASRKKQEFKGTIFKNTVFFNDANKLLKFHRNHKKMVTVTAVRPTARFGELEINSNNLVKKFEEKPQLYEGWINGGFFIFEPDIFDLIDNDETLLEREPLELSLIHI